MHDIINAHLLDSLGRNETEKKQILESENSPKDMYSSCYISTFKTFMRHCYPTCRSYVSKDLLFLKSFIFFVSLKRIPTLSPPKKLQPKPKICPLS
jgi:hypothetical protein